MPNTACPEVVDGIAARRRLAGEVQVGAMGEVSRVLVEILREAKE